MTRSDLQSDCTRCFALCCVLLPYSAAAGFGADKAGGTPCRNLDDADRCVIHSDLGATGWRGCTIFECFGAGQHVSQVTYGGRSWRDPDVNRGEMAAVLSAMRLVHEMLGHLEEALEHRPTQAGARGLKDRLDQIRGLAAEDVLAVDLDELLERVGDVLSHISAEVRSSSAAVAKDLIGRDLRRANLTDADLRGRLLIAADLRDVDLGRADLLGADLRDANVGGANLSRVLFLTQPQLNAACGDANTQIPPRLRHPWVN